MWQKLCCRKCFVTADISSFHQYIKNVGVAIKDVRCQVVQGGHFSDKVTFTDLQNFSGFSLACSLYFWLEKFRTSVNGKTKQTSERKS